MTPAARVALAAALTPAAALTAIVGERLWVHARNEVQAARRARRRARARAARQTFAASQRPGGGAVVFRNHHSLGAAHIPPGWASPLDGVIVREARQRILAAHEQDMADMAGTED